MKRFLFFIAALALVAAPLTGQSPNTATIVVSVIDQNGAPVGQATITALNRATGAVRESLTANDGNATLPALPLTGTYTVLVTREGFVTEQRRDITLRSGGDCDARRSAARWRAQ